MSMCFPQEMSGNGLTASEWVKSVAALIGGKGGGSKTSAQASGTNVEKLSEAVEAAKLFASSRVKWWEQIALYTFNNII